MITKTCIGTGWCAFNDGRANNKTTSKKCYHSGWIENMWKPFHELYFMPSAYHIHVSNCEVEPLLFSARNVFTQYTFSYDDVLTLPHSHDSQCSMIAGAQYAYCNEMHFIYIEQDCLVKGLDKAIKWALDNDVKIAFGSGEWSYNPTWIEPSFTFVHYDFLPQFISSMMFSNVKFADKTDKVPERVWSDLFGKSVTFWPFGYGRKGPVDMSEDAFYKQQLSDKEVEAFEKILQEA